MSVERLHDRARVIDHETKIASSERRIEAMAARSRHRPPLAQKLVDLAGLASALKLRHRDGRGRLAMTAASTEQRSPRNSTCFM